MYKIDLSMFSAWLDYKGLPLCLDYLLEVDLISQLKLKLLLAHRYCIFVGQSSHAMFMN